MFYIIIIILILLFYIFAAPSNIKGTFNIVSLVLLGVLFMILLAVGVVQFFRIPAEIFIWAAMLALAYFSLKDLRRLSIKGGGKPLIPIPEINWDKVFPKSSK
ncbi:DUF3165 family protein [Streptococcus sp. NLN76]|uniref:DUF3165 family protein n=1 Tax=Streptococcus sp. NLN76 TaxID=2822800 RepID=UPI0018ABB80D|nr:DUF3165 family protein [Streptococcus sp. NLN76]MBF8970398.1 DUF3165 family protein [Streptococcus sp. NLN76]